MKSVWDMRIRRATELSSVYPFAAEGLHFYAQLAMLQQNLAAGLTHASCRVFTAEKSFWSGLNSPAILPLFSGFVRGIRQIAPPPLAQSADYLSHQDPAEWRCRIEEFWRSPLPISDDAPSNHNGLAAQYLTWLFLQPFAEHLASQQKKIVSNGNARQCPVCSARPIVGVLRPEGDGARKSLICMLCAHEWAFRRIYCPSCGEEHEPNMAFYSAPEIPHIRVDICETCRTYTKSVDLTKNGLAIPVVDDLAGLPLDLWARQNGYHKLQINTVGI
jgi:FdhE protein